MSKYVSRRCILYIMLLKYNEIPFDIRKVILDIHNSILDIYKIRHTNNKCMICHIHLVNQQPLISMPFNEYKKGNIMCKRCLYWRVKCDKCSGNATNFIALNKDTVKKVCGRCNHMYP